MNTPTIEDFVKASYELDMKDASELGRKAYVAKPVIEKMIEALLAAGDDFLVHELKGVARGDFSEVMGFNIVMDGAPADGAKLIQVAGIVFEYQEIQ